MMIDGWIQAGRPGRKERPILFSGPMVRAILEGRKTQTRRVVATRHPIEFLGGRGQEADLSAWGWFFDGPKHHGYMVLARGLNERHDHGNISIPCPYGQPGDRLWVRETWAYNGQAFKSYGPQKRRREGYVTYATDGAKATHCFPDGPMLSSPPQTPPIREDSEDEFDFAMRDAEYYKAYFHRFRPSIHMPRLASRLTLEVTEVRVQRLQEISEEDAQAEGVGESALVHEGNPDVWAKHAHERYRLLFQGLWTKINGDRPGCSWEENPWVWVVSFRRLP